jgi:hypothetical protein
MEERMTTKDFPVFDADSHVVEPPTLWEKYLDPEYRTLGKHALWRQEGRTGAYLKVNGEIFRDTGNPNLPRHALWRPGITWDAIGALDPHIKHAATEGASDRQARLADLDTMGIDQALLYPTWFAEGFFLVHDPDVAYALARAYNDWIADFCKAGPERLFAAAILSLQSMDFASRNCSGWCAFRQFVPSLSDRCFSKTAISIIPITTRYGPNWNGSGSRRRCMPHRGCGTRNGPRTGHS